MSEIEAHSVLYLAHGELVVASLFCEVYEVILVVNGYERAGVSRG